MVYFSIVQAPIMRNDQIFVLLLVILLPMSGCFDGAVGDAEGTDDASENSDTSGGEGTSTGTASSTQARTWYCLLYTSPSPRDRTRSRMPSSA